MNMRTVLYTLALWLAGVGIAAAQANSIDSFDVTEQGGKVLVRITTKSPLSAVPPNFSVANPARIAFDFPSTMNALGRSKAGHRSGRAAQHEHCAGRRAHTSGAEPAAPGRA